MKDWPTVVLSLIEATAVEQALSWLRQGQVVAFPTDTVYGIGVPMDDIAAVERLYQVKERPYSMAIPLLLAETADIERVCSDLPWAAWRLAERFWPGGLSMVLRRRENVPDLVSAGQATVAVRLPDHWAPRELARRLGTPLAATSANRSGAPSPVTAEEVLSQLGGRVPLILDGGECPEAQPSTLVDLSGDPPVILRAGPISRAMIEAALDRAVEDRSAD